MTTEQFYATAYVDGNETGRIDDVPSGNIMEFLHAHLEGTPWEPETLADEVVVKRGGRDE